MPLLHFTCLSLILLPQIPVSFLLSACYSFCPFMHCLNLSAVPTSSSQACLFLLCVSMSLDSIAKSFDTLLNCCLYFIKLHLNLYILKLSLPYYQLYAVVFFCFVLLFVWQCQTCIHTKYAHHGLYKRFMSKTKVNL